MAAEAHARPATRLPLRGREVTIVANDIAPVGGMERVLTELVMGLRDQGYAVTVIARTFDVPDANGIAFHRVRGPRRPFVIAHPWFVLAGSFALRRRRRGLVQATGAIVLNRVDIVHVHFCHQVGPAFPSRSTPFYRAHARLVGLMKRLGERVCFAANRPATFVCVSDGVADEIRHHYPGLAGRVVTIHNGVDTRAFAPGVRAAEAHSLRRRLGISDAAKVALFVGSEWHRKGLRPLIEALAQAPEWQLLVAGSGDRMLYQRLADSLGVGEALHWLGVSSDMSAVYQAADAFVLPSAYETFSLVSFEAAASGLPILVTPVSGARELIEDGHNGFLITQDPSAIGDRLRRLAADESLGRKLGSTARAAALAFSWEQMVRAHSELYGRLAVLDR